MLCDEKRQTSKCNLVTMDYHKWKIIFAYNLEWYPGREVRGVRFFWVFFPGRGGGCWLLGICRPNDEKTIFFCLLYVFFGFLLGTPKFDAIWWKENLIHCQVKGIGWVPLMNQEGQTQQLDHKWYHPSVSKCLENLFFFTIWCGNIRGNNLDDNWNGPTGKGIEWVPLMITKY